MLIDCATAPADVASRFIKALVIPRPIGWISTLGQNGVVNLAPYSFFNVVDDNPPILMFSSNGLKDSARNSLETGEFVANLVTEPLVAAMNASSARLPPDSSEFDYTGLASAASVKVKPPRVAEAAAAMECKVLEVRQLKDLKGEPLETYLVFGQVVMMHVADRIISNGRIDLRVEVPIARLDGMDYAAIRDRFSLKRPQ